MFDWITQVFDKLLLIVPKMVRVTPTHDMVKWPFCREAVVCGPGIIWYWPLFTEVQLVDIRWQSTLCYLQTITMRDGTTVTARALCIWRVDDPITSVVDNADYADRTAELTQSIVANLLASVTREQLVTVAALNAALSMECRQQMREVGIQVKDCMFTELAVTKTIRLMGQAE